jgi:CTP-dependent riboflavin kinase
MSRLRRHTGFNLVAGTLNVEIEESRHEFRPDHEVSREENNGRESVAFERCRIHYNGLSVRALITRTSTDWWGKGTDHKLLEFMAEYWLRGLFSLQDGDRIEIEVYDGPDAATEANAATKYPNVSRD